jgi:hypothetical protein
MLRTLLKRSAAKGAQLFAEGPAAAPKFQTAGVQVPFVDNFATIDPSSVLTGNIVVGSEATVGKQVVVKGLTHRVDIGAFASIGEGAVLTAASASQYSPETGLPNACIVGKNAVVGARAVLESCVVEDEAVVARSWERAPSWARARGWTPAPSSLPRGTCPPGSTGGAAPRASWAWRRGGGTDSSPPCVCKLAAKTCYTNLASLSTTTSM